MTRAHAAIYDATTGQVIATALAPPDMLGGDWVEIQEGQGVDDDPAAWVVNLATGALEYRGRVPEREEINLERDARIAAGFAFGRALYQFRAEDKQRIAGAATLAGFALAQGAASGNFYWHGGSQPFTWITADNSPVMLDASAMFTLGQVAANHETVHIFAARALKDATIAPLDYADDHHWPARPGVSP